jgi:hypothetical protein
MIEMNQQTLSDKKRKTFFTRKEAIQDILAFSDRIECAGISNESLMFDDIRTIEDVQRKIEKEKD